MAWLKRIFQLIAFLPQKRLVVPKEVPTPPPTASVVLVVVEGDERADSRPEKSVSIRSMFEMMMSIPMLTMKLQCDKSYADAQIRAEVAKQKLWYMEADDSCCQKTLLLLEWDKLQANLCLMRQDLDTTPLDNV
jgi:hypothetical protein